MIPRAVADGENGQLGSLEPLLDDDHVAGGAESALIQALGKGSRRLLVGVADGHPLAGGETVRLHHAVPGPLENEVDQTISVLTISRTPACGGDTGTIHQRLGMALAPLDLGRGRRRTEDGQPGVPAGVGDPGGERGVRSDHDEVDLSRPSQARQRRTVGRGDVHVDADLGRPGVARRADDLGFGTMLGAAPGEGMLPPTRADDEDTHGRDCRGSERHGVAVDIPRDPVDVGGVGAPWTGKAPSRNGCRTAPGGAVSRVGASSPPRRGSSSWPPACPR